MSLTDRIRDEFAQFAAAPSYPCIGARSAVRRGDCRVEVYGPMDDEHSSRRLASDLATFANRPAAADLRFVAFAAIFLEAAPETELEFERRLWHQLSSLSAHDANRSATNSRSADPADPDYAFSLNGTPYFVIGLHPESVRQARRLPWPALVFNPHSQFDRLRADGIFEPMRRTIRSRDLALQGDLNPNLADVGEESEARQYSGRAVEKAWRCPFHPSK
ncbi:MAG: guanitoxin biosynthesis heme-dependent pre-guanitoxin N-hydroxylase GntA [Gemmatimonadaceae bacterium]